MKKSIKITIEQATLKDLKEVADLYTHFWGDKTNLEKMNHTFGKISNDSRYCFLVARFETRVVGTIYGIVCEELYGDCRPFMIMEDLIVSPDERRKGVAKMLLSELESKAKNGIAHKYNLYLSIKEKMLFHFMDRKDMIRKVILDSRRNYNRLQLQ